MKCQFKKSSSTNRHAFTLVEIMIVVIIIGVLASIAIPSFSKARQTARTKQADHEVNMIYAAIDQLAWDTGMWPGAMPREASQWQEITDLSTAHAGLVTNDGDFNNWAGPYIGSVNLDPWGQRYFFDPDYLISGVWYVACGSYGPNRVGRNIYDSDNIYDVFQER